MKTDRCSADEMGSHWSALADRPALPSIAQIAASLLAAVVSTAAAQTYPDKPVRMVVPFAPGGGADFIARPMAHKLTESLGQYIIIDNRGGANGAIGAEAVARATPDGYTLLFGSAGVMTTGPLLDTRLKYSAERDFVPVALLAEVPFFLIAHSSVRAKTMKELVALARTSPGKLKYGSSGIGGAPHLAGELLNSIAKIDTLHIAYRGLGPVLTDLLAGRIDFTFVGINVVQQHVSAGRLVALGTTGDRRSPIAPELPTMAEAGLTGFKAGTWYGVHAPAGTARAVVVRLNDEMNRALAQPDMKERLAATGAEPAGNTPEQFATFMRNERQRWGAVIKTANIRLEP
jgi:tripartite-type tricarboxylate transporter receptor subunit TctC